jgi:hypothetical protein
VHAQPDPQEHDAWPDRPGERTLELPAADDPADWEAAETQPQPLRRGPIWQVLEASAEFTEVAATAVLDFVRSIIP